MGLLNFQKSELFNLQQLVTSRFHCAPRFILMGNVIVLLQTAQIEKRNSRFRDYETKLLAEDICYLGMDDQRQYKEGKGKQEYCIVLTFIHLVIHLFIKC
jgi:hypothetical protein